MTVTEQLQTVDKQVTDAVEKGASLHTGGSAIENFYEPTVLSGVTRNMSIWHKKPLAQQSRS